MSNLDMVWSDLNSRGDLSVVGGRMSTGNLLVTAVIISLFTDRLSPPDFTPPDGTTNRRGWWVDSFDGVYIGSRLWTLRRRKIANRAALIAEATEICQEALAWMLAANIVATVNVYVQAPAGGPSQGSVLEFFIELVEPSGAVTQVRKLWSTV